MTAAVPDRLKIVLMTDDWDEAGREADRLWLQEHRRCGRETVRNWNQMHPEQPVKAVERYLVFEEKT